MYGLLTLVRKMRLSIAVLSNVHFNRVVQETNGGPSGSVLQVIQVSIPNAGKCIFWGSKKKLIYKKSLVNFYR